MLRHLVAPLATDPATGLALPAMRPRRQWARYGKYDKGRFTVATLGE
jgi:hypothetical protein